MKNLKFIFLLAIAISFVSCNSDDDSDEVIISIVGLWTGQNVDLTGTTSTTFDGTTINATITGEEYDMDYTLNFREDPNLVSSSGGFGIRLSTTIAGITTVEDIPNTDFLENGTWSKSGNTLTVTTVVSSRDFRILQLTDSMLSLESTETQEVDNPTTGISVSSTTKTVFTFTR